MRERTAAAVSDWATICDAEIAVVVLGGAWKPTILSLLLRHGECRFGELRRSLPSVTQRILTRQLRELEADGLVLREECESRPPKVVAYSLTDTGRAAAALLAELTSYGQHYRAAFGTECPRTG